LLVDLQAEQSQFEALLDRIGAARINQPGVAGHWSGATRVFVEVDQGTRPIASWGDKARAYHAYRGSQKLRQRYGVEDFLLLVIAPTLGRRTRIAEVIVEATRQHSSLAFMLTERLHPSTVRAYLEIIAQVQWDTRPMPHGLVTVPNGATSDGPRLRQSCVSVETVYNKSRCSSVRYTE